MKKIFIIFQFIIILFIIISTTVFPQKTVLERIDKISSAKERLNEIVKLFTADEVKDITTRVLIAERGHIISQELGDKKSELCMLLNLGDIYKELNSVNKSQDYYTNGLKIARSIGDSDYEMKINQRLGELMRFAGSYQQALSYLNNALSMGIQKKSTTIIAKAENRLAAVYFELLINYMPGSYLYDPLNKKGSYNPNLKRIVYEVYKDSAIYFANKSMKTGQGLSNGFYELSNLNILASVSKFMLDYDGALKQYLEGIKLAVEYKNNDMLCEILTNLHDLYFRRGEMKMAFSTLDKLDSLTDKSPANEITRANIDLSRSEYYAATNDIPNAYKLLRLSYEHRRTVFNQEAVIKLTNEKIEQERDEFNRLREGENREKILWIVFLSVLATMTLFITVAIFLRHRKLKKIYNTLDEKSDTITRQNVELKELNQMKDKFFRIVAHDLKSPMWGVAEYAKILLSEYEDLSHGERKDIIGNLFTSLNGLNDLTINLLNLTALQNSNKKLSPINFPIKEMLKKIENVYNVNFTFKSVSFVNTVPENIMVYADTTSLHCILHNLIGNALKFTPQCGGIFAIYESTDPGYINIGIRDTGKGVPAEIQTKLFKFGETVSTQGTAGEKGTGLGLQLCKELIDLNGGKIWFENLPKGGAIFWISIPVQAT